MLPTGLSLVIAEEACVDSLTSTSASMPYFLLTTILTL